MGDLTVAYDFSMASQVRGIAPVLLFALLATGQSAAAERRIDGATTDWCFGVPTNPRIEDSAIRLGCGFCDAVEPVACMIDADCASGQTCIGSQEELVWYDGKTDSVANDLRTVAAAQDTFALYVVIDWHTSSDPTTLPNIQMALDFRPGGTHDLVDPHGTMVAPGVCSVSTDRACTEDADCYFCTHSFEYPPCCDEGTCEAGELCRVRICGSGCNPEDPLDVCDTSQTCLGLGTTPIANVGLNANPLTRADYLVTYDLSRWLFGVYDAVQLSRWTGAWTALGTFDIAVAWGIPTRPPSLALETAITWDGFGCTGWTAQDGCGAGATASSCGCPDFGPGTPFSFTTVVSRGNFTLDFTPSGAIEDVASEAIAGTTTRTPNSCPGAGIGVTQCEIADASTDTFGPELALDPGGTLSGLRIVRNGTGPTSPITLRWNPSCSFGDTDYGVYEGNLHALPGYDHAQVLCSTSGETTATFDAGSGDRYYLVVPTDGVQEGSYGAPAQRPPATIPCRAQVATFSCGE
jgi:hypothetical protein